MVGRRDIKRESREWVVKGGATLFGPSHCNSSHSARLLVVTLAGHQIAHPHMRQLVNIPSLLLHPSLRPAPATNERTDSQSSASVLMGQTTRGPYSTDLAQIRPFSIRSALPPDNNRGINKHPTVSSDRRRWPSTSHLPSFCIRLFRKL